MKKISSKVSYFLKNYPKTRDNDFDLAFEIWARGGVIFTPEEQQKIKLAHKICSFFTIERVRREFRTEYPGTGKVEQARMTEAQKYQEWYRRNA